MDRNLSIIETKRKPFSVRFLVPLCVAAIALAAACDQGTTPASTNADLSSLTSSAGKLSPDFAAETTAYTVALPNSTDSLTVTGAAADSGATVGGDSGVAKPLAVGSTAITVTVTAADGATTKSYTVTATRAAIFHIAFDKSRRRDRDYGFPRHR